MDPEAPADAHEMLCIHWPGSWVKLKATPDRVDLDGRLAKIAGADHLGHYQVVVLPVEENKCPETVFVPLDCVKTLPDDHPKKNQGFPPSSFRGPSKLLRFQIGDWVRANMDQGWVLGQIGGVWNPDGSIYIIMFAAPEGPGFMTVQAPKDTRQYVRFATRFQLGDRVQCNVGEKWLDGMVIDFAVENGNTRIAYKVQVHDGVLNAPLDEDECVRKIPEPLRFEEGDRVQANMGGKGWVKGVILKANQFYNKNTPAYVIHLDDEEDDNQHVTAPRDNDAFVRSLDWKHTAERRFKVVCAGGYDVYTNDSVIHASILSPGRITT